MNPIYEVIHKAVLDTIDAAHQDLRHNTHVLPDGSERDACYHRRFEQVMALQKLMDEALPTFIQAGASFETADPMLRTLQGALHGLIYWDPNLGCSDAMGRLTERLGIVQTALQSVRLLAVAYPGQKQVTPPQKPEESVIVSLGDRQYRIGKNTPLTVTPPHDAVLKAFIKRPTMDEPTLRNLANGLDEPAKALRDLRKKYGGQFAPAITLPGRKSQGGYHVRIVQELSASSPH
jgi:hypothetical protein